MNKPKKKENVSWQMSGGFDRGYNQACDDWEGYLPSEEEIASILNDKFIQGAKVQVGWIAKAISKRLRGNQ